MSTNSFFDEQQYQSLVKAEIVEKYFWAWAKVVIHTVKKKPVSQQKIAYIDLFAGPGRYKDGSKSTPIKVLEKAVADADMRHMLVSIFNDGNADNTQSLQEAISTIPEIQSLKHYPQIWNYEVGENIVEIFQDMKLVPTLFFVDPWGYKGLSLELINSVVKYWGCDCLFFFNYNRINMGLGNDAVKNHMDSLFGKDRADLVRTDIKGCSSQERELIIVEAICQSLKEMGGEYTLPFRFKNEAGNRTSHHLIFVSKNVKGYTIMKEIMAQVSSQQMQGVASFEYSPATSQQPLLFELSKPIDELENVLLDEFARQTLTMKEIYDRHHVGKPYISKNYKQALSNLEVQGRITVRDTSGKTRRKNTFADHLGVIFPAKQ